ncbi:hypothetical protein BABINDRAFT_163782 [Babjeviella inositovora NRRL Y-12698]|uniref:Chromatin structure-remodeling complex subunit RSC7 n=1 Tax=Babjeviella inositovora NRRL Y-12698 TaxID=984486 RepID=A0A1E3QHG8_9ASCO|nr:uncharacterized protein BABINDRAFT_163782 [Babjeviella inositovora NRRL Y-12698]ODQ77048.1 hypothetical protein BABINDRAFT_163782 [Babjeviella inositovora NRRL Y-12698]
MNRRKSRRLSSLEGSDTEERLASRSRSRRTTVEVVELDTELGINPEELPQDDEDDDYSGASETEKVEEEEEEHVSITDDLTIDDKVDKKETVVEVVEPPRRKGRGRPPGAKNRATIEREKRGIFKTPKRRLESQDGRRKRRTTVKKPDAPLVDDDGNPLEVRDDEIVVTPDVDGETKIDINGILKGGRVFRERTFTVFGKGEKRYMLSTEPARCVGFRDSYLLFHKHKHLYKYVCSPEEKADLIERDLLPPTYKGRSISLVTARSIYREFGARIIVNGRRVTDDYYEQRARDLGAREGEIVDPLGGQPAQYVPWNPISTLAHPTAKNDTQHVVLTDENWRYQHALSARLCDEELARVRANVYALGAKDSYSGLLFFPAHTQPLHAAFVRVEGGIPGKVVVDTVVQPPPGIKFTGLKDVPLDVFDGVVSEEVKAAIIAQQQAEAC